MTNSNNNKKITMENIGMKKRMKKKREMKQKRDHHTFLGNCPPTPP